MIAGIDTPAYAGLRNREDEGWYPDTMKETLSGMLTDANEEYSLIKKTQSSIDSWSCG